MTKEASHGRLFPRYQWLFSSADAGSMDRCVCFSGLENNWHAGGELLLERPQERHIACGIQSGLGDRMPAVQRILFNAITAAMGL
jgi:hypothetical protein